MKKVNSVETDHRFARAEIESTGLLSADVATRKGVSFKFP